MIRIHSEHISSDSILILSKTKGFNDYGKEENTFRLANLLRFLFFILLVFYVPAILIWTQILPFEYRFHTFFIVLASCLFYCGRRRYSLHELGFRTDNLSNSIRWNLLFCGIGAIGLYLTYKTGFSRPRNTTNFFPYAYAAYIFFLGPVQEVVFRGVLFAEMKRIRILDQKWILMISTLSFCFLHIIYRHPPLLIITFVSGLVWGIIFTKWRNIWGISLSHSLLGALAMFLGVI
jgi:uncharacterized protein